MGNYKPLFYSLIFLFGIGIFLTLLSPLILIDETVANPNNPISNLTLYTFTQEWVNASFVDLIPTGYHIFNIFNFTGFELKIPVINPFALMGVGVQTYFQEQLILFTYIPYQLSLPILILISLSLIWSIIKLIIP